jgi:transcriptional regulator with XRE-family HTH domain
MSNERLRSAILAKGLTYADLAQQVAVDPKTVERWVTQPRQPHRAHRLRVSALLDSEESFLWPETASSPATLSASQSEFVELFPNRGSIRTDQWLSWIDQANDQIDLLAYAASFFHDAVPGGVDLLAAKARAGVQVRVLFGNPGCEAVRTRGEEEGIADLLAARCRLTWNYWAPILETPGVEARQHETTLYNSIFRFDETMLVNTHALGVAASHSPVLQLQKVAGGRLFSQYLASFHRVWDLSRATDWRAMQPTSG